MSAVASTILETLRGLDHLVAEPFQAIGGLVADRGDLPNPAPLAPEELWNKARRIMAFTKWISLISAAVLLTSFGALAWAGDRGGMGGMSADMKEKFGKVIIGLAVALSAASIVGFVKG